MKAKNIIVFLSLVVLVSCKTTSETRVSKIDDQTAISESGIIYALPRTNLKFAIEASRTDVIPGPYYEYAEKYLGIENVSKEKTTAWQISNIVVNSYNDIDPEQFYIVEPSGKMNIDINKLIQNGNIVPVNKSVKSIFSNDFYGVNKSESELVFTNLSTTKFVGKEKFTYFKRVQRDSLFAKVPVTQTQSVYKSFEDKAEEAAGFIFIIREKRFELLTGMADFYPEGNSLALALDELNKLENDYLELFIGKRFISDYTACFEFTPTETELSQPYIIFRFNEDKGILPPNDLRGRPIIVELDKKDQLNNFSFLMSDQINRPGTEYKDKFYIRIPDLVNVKVFDGNTLLAKRKVNVEQYGVIVPIPSMFLMGNEKFIEFYRDDED
ncbi:MAG: DUF4831 family protein [Bacteroidales bacterium]|jgi:hypothetical protein|nr:DUF4831 family protein [Bacteroidales bacterium]